MLAISPAGWDNFYRAFSVSARTVPTFQLGSLYE